MMIIFKDLKANLIAILFVLFASTAFAQQDGANVASPYTIYGFGQLNTLGTAETKSMAGAGVALNNQTFMNTLNPAGLGSVPQQTFLFDFGMQGDNNYLSTSNGKTSSNRFNLSDIGFQFPLTKNLGFGFSLNPYSSVGYTIVQNSSNPDLESNIGSLSTEYQGSGGITLAKASMGWSPLKGFSIGASMMLYHCSIERNSYSVINPILANGDYRTYTTASVYQFNKINGEVGVNYSYKTQNNANLSVAAVYQPRMKIEATNNISSSTIGAFSSDSIYYSVDKEQITMPDKYTVGVAYSSPKLNIALDYTYQNFDGAFDLNNGEANGVSLSAYQDIKLGIAYTPERFNVRRMMDRWTYRLGARYGTSYLAFNNHAVKDYSVVAGVGIPLQKFNFSLINVGVDVGQRSSFVTNDMKETYFKLYVGVNMFVVKEWFIRHKFQ